MDHDSTMCPKTARDSEKAQTRSVDTIYHDIMNAM
jgi:hypothetical protein